MVILRYRSTAPETVTRSAVGADAYPTAAKDKTVAHASPEPLSLDCWMVTVGVPESQSVISRYATMPALVAALSSRLVELPALEWVSFPVVKVSHQSRETPVAWESIENESDPSEPRLPL